MLKNSYKKITLSLSVGVLLSAILYGYFLHLTVGAVVERRRVEIKASDLSSMLTDLEVRYLAEQNKINFDLAYSLGFVDIGDTQFVALGGGGLTLADGPSGF